MLLVPHYVAPSQIHGFGCFSSSNVDKGERIWEFHPLIDRVIHEADLASLPVHVVKLIRNHAEFIPDENVFRLAADGDFFMNHSNDPNFELFGNHATARRTIFIGEEITCDYHFVKVWSFPINEIGRLEIFDQNSSVNQVVK